MSKSFSLNIINFYYFFLLKMKAEGDTNEMSIHRQ